MTRWGDRKLGAGGGGGQSSCPAVCVSEWCLLVRIHYLSNVYRPAASLLQAHGDAVLHMAMAAGTEGAGGMSGRLLLTCSRDGVVKAWK